MSIDLDAALGAAPSERHIAWTDRDVLLYHLSLGAGRDPGRGPELGLTYERALSVLPTFAMVAGQGVSAGAIGAAGLALPGIDVDLRKILHSGQSVCVHRSIPAQGEATISTRVADLWDKGKAAVISLESAATSPEGDLLWTSRMSMWARGEGGFGGEPGPSDEVGAPAGEPDLVLDIPTTPDQALLYRLNGDLNPLHVDPDIAGAMGFERPILHGLATYGLLALAITRELLDGDPARLSGLEVRFAGTVLPGDTLRTSIWHDGGRLRLHTVDLDRDGAVVLSHAVATVVAS